MRHGYVFSNIILPERRVQTLVTTLPKIQMKIKISFFEADCDTKTYFLMAVSHERDFFDLWRKKRKIKQDI